MSAARAFRARRSDVLARLHPDRSRDRPRDRRGDHRADTAECLPLPRERARARRGEVGRRCLQLRPRPGDPNRQQPRRVLRRRRCRRYGGQRARGRRWPRRADPGPERRPARLGGSELRDRCRRRDDSSSRPRPASAGATILAPASEQAPDDMAVTAIPASGSSFFEPDGATAATWVQFRPDGVPVAIDEQLRRGSPRDGRRNDLPVDAESGLRRHARPARRRARARLEFRDGGVDLMRSRTSRIGARQAAGGGRA